jgi:hypothetical protein
MIGIWVYLGLISNLVNERSASIDALGAKGDFFLD